MKSAPFLLMVLLGLMLSTQLKAQYPVMQHWAQENGLPSNIVFDVAQDSHGYIWFGSEKGLSRFDGKDIRQYTHPKMKGTAVSNVFEDKQGRIWCQNFIGQKFFVTADSMHFAEKLPVAGNYSRMLRNENGEFIIGSAENVSIYNPETLEPKRQLLIDGYIVTMNLQQKQLWVMTDNQLFQFKDEKLSSTYDVSHVPTPADYLLAWMNNRMYAFPKMSNEGFVYDVFPSKGKMNLLPSNVVVQSVKVFGDSMLWVGTTAGLYLFDQEMKPLFDGQALLSGHSISSTMQDRDGAYWISTIDHGLYRITDLNTIQWESKDESFTVFSHRNDAKEILIGTESGKVLSLGNDGLKTSVEAATRHRVSVILNDSARKVMVSATDKIYISKEGKPFDSFTAAGKDLLKTNEGLLVLALTGAVRVWDMNKPTSEFKQITLGSSTFRSSSLTQHTKSGKVQVATSIGICEFDPRSDSVATLLFSDVVANHLIWIGDTLAASTQNGILLFHAGKQMASLGSKEGIKGSVGRLQLYRGTLYARAENVMYEIRPSDLKLLKSSLLASSNSVIDYLLQDGLLYVASGSHINRVSLSKPSKVSMIPKVELLEFRSNDRLISQFNSEVLNYDQNNIQIHYSVPWFDDLSSLKVQYRVNESDWQTNDPMLRTINLPFLSAGDYQIEMRVLLTNGWVSSSEVLTFRIRAPLYKRWWFQGVLFFLLASAFYGLYRYRVRMMGRQNLLLQEKLKLEQELERSLLASIRSQMNPHFIFNALNTIQSYIYSNDRNNAVNYLGKFAQLTRKVLDMSNHERVSLAEELEALNLYLELEKMRFEESLEVKVEVDSDIYPEGCKIPPMLIQPYVENALKHGLLHRKENRKLRCSFRKEGKVLVVEIADNGIGRKRSREMNEKSARQHISFSTVATQKRIELMNSTLPEGFSVEYVDHINTQGEAEGTTVILRMAILI
ncbi:MAG: histidine kinase [Flavobacteriales bacterium]|nr:histidine kinase [Flavobacteriales bacterium]